MRKNVPCAVIVDFCASLTLSSYNTVAFAYDSLCLQNSYYENEADDFFYDCSDEELNYEEDIYNNEMFDQPSYTRLFDLLEEEDSNDTVTANLVVSKIEMLLTILTFSSVYSLPNVAVADLCKMFNCFMDSPILPDTHYMIDQLFFPGEGIQYHAVCPECKNYIKKYNKQDSRVFCELCEIYIDVKDPSYHDFFVILDISNQLRHLFENNYDYYLSVINNREAIGRSSNYEDIYYGRKYQDFVESLPENQRRCYLTTTFNSDGSPVFKRSKFSIWPIQICPPSARKKPLTYALWFGHDKPNMNVFLTQFVNGINKLSTVGFQATIENEIKTIKVFAVCCCVDSVARAPMQGFIQFNGYYGCPWCLHPGTSVIHRKRRVVKYTLLDEIPQKRTEKETLIHIEESITSGTTAYGVKKATPLLLLNRFNIIDGFVPDPMHCIDLGVVKQFSNYWFNTSNKAYSIKKEIQRIEKYVSTLKVPT